jgi:hypothetical protein
MFREHPPSRAEWAWYVFMVAFYVWWGWLS